MKAIAPQPVFSTRAAAEIRTAILHGSLPPGTRIRQEDLAARLGVSREPIRKALLVLEREGLVNNVPNHGAIVAPLDAALISEIYEFRDVIESYVAGQVAEKEDFDPTALGKIALQGRKAVAAGSLDRIIDLDVSFHGGLYRACGNRVVVDVMQTQWGHIRRAMLMVLRSVEHRNQVWDEHEALLEAIVAKNPPLARSLASAHCQGARSWVTTELERNSMTPVEKQ